MKLTAFLFCLFAIILSACSDSPPEEAFTPPPVGILDTGDHLVTLHATPESPVYTIEDQEGTVIARKISREDFAAQFPEIFKEISSLWAGNRRGELEADEMTRPIFQDLIRE